ncbi:MAG: tetratricopeptide repeat protein [Solirubrobacteraceae bacterium]
MRTVRRLRMLGGLAAVGVWTLGFAPVLYLALAGGGYDLVVHSQAGIAAWWIVLCGAAAGVLPAMRLRRGAWVALGALLAYLAWNLVGISWSSSAERSLEAAGMVAVYAGFFALGVLALNATRLRCLINGMACALAIVGVMAVLSRLHPQWFARDQVAVFFGPQRRLNYPVNYADALGELLAMGVPVLLGVSARARTLAGGALAAAALPVLCLGIVLSISRGGAIAAVAGVAALLILLPDRLPAIATAVIAAAGSAVAVDALLQRAALRNNLTTHEAVLQRGQMIVILLAVCAGVALVHVAVALWSRHASRPAWMRPSRRRVSAISGLAAAAAIVVALAAGAPAALSHEWRQFQRVNSVGVSPTNGFTRFGTLSGSHRYQYWQAALSAFETNELHGIGPGTFQFWWLAHNSVSEYVRNAHSLYMEALAELGLVGLALLLAFVVGLIGFGAWRCVHEPPSSRRALAIAVAAFTVFAICAAYDWVWQISVIPVAAMLLGAGIVAADRRADAPAGRCRSAGRVIFALAALGCLGAIAIPMASTVAVRESESAVRSGHLAAALGDAASAQAIEPYAATPRLQQALVLEQEGRYREAARAAAEATARSPQDWQLWLVRSRIDAEAGDPREALAEYRRARSLNPRSSLFS